MSNHDPHDAEPKPYDQVSNDPNDPSQASEARSPESTSQLPAPRAQLPAKKVSGVSLEAIARDASTFSTSITVEIEPAAPQSDKPPADDEFNLIVKSGDTT